MRGSSPPPGPPPRSDRRSAALAIGLFGPVTTVVIDAVSYLFSAAAIRAIGGSEPHPARTDASRLRAGDLLEGWRTILTNPALRPLFFNTILVNGLIMATAPLIAVLMLGHLGFTPWQYGLAFGAPCVGGLIGSRLARPLVARFGQHKVMLIAGALRACWPLGLAFIQPGATGIVLVIAVQFGLVTCIGVFNPVFASYRLDQTATDRVARTLSAWSVTSNATIAALTALWGLLAGITGPRMAIAIAGVLLLATPLLLPRRDRASSQDREPAPSRRNASGMIADFLRRLFRSQRFEQGPERPRIFGAGLVQVAAGRAGDGGFGHRAEQQTRQRLYRLPRDQASPPSLVRAREGILRRNAGHRFRASAPSRERPARREE